VDSLGPSTRLCAPPLQRHFRHRPSVNHAWQDQQLGLEDQLERGLGEPYIYHFPDGNASIAWLLVRSVIPSVARGHTMEDVVLADFDYAKLDSAVAPIRLRLNSTAVTIANARTPPGPRSGVLHRVHARYCVLACYNMMIPYLMPELPDAQKQALALCVKLPLVHTNVAVHNWRAFVNLGIDRIYSPSGYFVSTKLDYPRVTWRVSQSASARRADAPSHGACPADTEPGSLERRAIPPGKATAAQYSVRGVREADYRSA
jgi:hypothetical protein